ncbi:MAG: DsbA family protein [Candidatus Micrarchaeota archaeon]|nr:DsbA family protein [Candidatus Micrarchaeota archaeon]
MLCFVALFVFAFLSLFSAKYRPLAKRAFGCVLRKATLRPCEAGLDEELRAKSIAEIMRVSPRAAVFVNKHFELFSFAFTLLFFLSLAFTAQGVANFVLYGNCNGPEGGFCIYSELQNPALLKSPTTLQGIRAGNLSSDIVVFEFGCYVCPYTAGEENKVRKMLEEYKDRVQFVFKPFPLPSHPYSLEAAVAAACASEGGKYWEYRAELFKDQHKYSSQGDAAFKKTASDLNISGFDECYDKRKFLSQVEATLKEGKECGIYGTPTFFVGGKAFVGKNSADQAEAEIKRLLGRN